MGRSPSISGEIPQSVAAVTFGALEALGSALCRAAAAPGISLAGGLRGRLLEEISRPAAPTPATPPRPPPPDVGSGNSSSPGGAPHSPSCVPEASPDHESQPLTANHHPPTQRVQLS